MARKVIAKAWMQTPPPTIWQWKKDVNDTPTFKKLVYAHRGCVHKFSKVWDRWLEDGET